MSGKRGTDTVDSVLYLGRLLVHECDYLSQILHFSFGRKYHDMHPVDLDFSQFGCFLVNFEQLRFCASFEVSHLL